MSTLGMAGGAAAHTGERTHGGGRVFLDCTQTISTPRQAGIPRVVRNIARHGAAAAAAHGAVLVPVRFAEDRFVALGMASTGDLIDVSTRAAPPCHPLLHRLHKLLVPRTIMRAVRTQWRKLFRSTHSGERIEFQPGDTLLLADSSWTSRCWHAVDEARAAGTRLGVVQYDFIPHTHPELMPKRLPATFRDWMTNTLTRVDFVAAISEAVAVEAREELRRLGREPERARPLVQSFRLGADVEPAMKVEAPRPELAAFIAAGSCGPYLTVGTLEPRKNQALLMDVFERVWQQVPEARLLVAGFVGWKGDAVVRRASRVHATDAAGVRDAARRRAAILIAERPRRSEADCGPRAARAGRAGDSDASVRGWRAGGAGDSDASGGRAGRAAGTGETGETYL